MSSNCLECSKKGLDCCKESHAKFLTLRDALRISEYLGGEVGTFARYASLNQKDLEEYIYIHRDRSYYYDLTLRDGRLLQIREKGDGSCMFQEADGRCRIYPVRPLICRTYPFWLSEEGEVIFDWCSSDCPLVCSVTGNDAPEDIAKLEDPTGTCRTHALRRIGHSRRTIRPLLEQMMGEIEDYRENIDAFIECHRPGLVDDLAYALR